MLNTLLSKKPKKGSAEREKSGEVEDYFPPLFFRSAHVQSIMPSLGLRKRLNRKRARRMLECSEEVLIDAGEGVRLQGFFSARPNGNGDLAILIHGWEGSSDSHYLVSAAGKLYEEGFHVFRLNLRDHGATHHLNEGLFHSCLLDEVTMAVKRVKDIFSQGGKTFLVGFSLGGNFALRVAVQAPNRGFWLDHVIAVCPVIYPKGTLTSLDKGSPVYQKYFIWKWKKSLKIKMHLFPGAFDFGNRDLFKNLESLTDYFVHHYTDFADLDAYLEGYSITGDGLKKLKIPSHIFSAMDDPVISFKDVDDLFVSDALRVVPVSYGGHCGFIKDYALNSWIDDQIVQILLEG